jgi:hypothetical protein
MKRSSAILKSLVVLGILTFGLVAGVPAQGLEIQRHPRVPPTPIMPPVPPAPIPHPIPIPTPITKCTPLPAGLVGWWKGEGNALDSSGLGNNGVAINIGYTNGIVGQAFACDPNNYPYGTYNGIQIPDQPAYVLTNALSIEGWIRPRGDGYCIFWRGDGRSGLDPYVLSMQGNNTLDFFIEDELGDFAFVGTDLNYNQWYHVAATWDGSTGTMSIYTNGVLAGQTVTDVRPFGELIPEYSPGVGIGNVNDGYNNFPFTGDIDEISLYNRALSAAEVQAIYNAGSGGKCPIAAPTCVSEPSGLIGWWPAEGNGNDSAGTNNATVPDGVTYAPAEVGPGFSLDGQDHRIIVPDAPELNFSSNQDFSIEVWILPLASPDNWKDVMSVVDKRVAPDTITQLGYELNLEGGVVVFQMADTLAPFSWHNFSGGPDLRDGQFHHVAVTVQRNSTSGGQLYIDGQMVLTFDPTVCPGDLSNTGPLRIGNHATPDLPAFYHGIIDEVSLYNRALSSNEIASIYNAGSAGKCARPLPPGIAVPPLNQITVQGSNVVLSVVASGTGPFSYQWSFNGTNILGATNATLTLTNLHPNQSGSYAVTITTPYGSITSSNVSVTVIAQNILVYKYAGIQKIITSGLALSYAYAGQMFFIPDKTNGVFVGWATIKGKKQCWVNPLPEYLWITISGVSNQSFTVLGQAGQAIDTNGYPNIWTDLHKGQNTVLTIGQKKYFSFPNTFASDATHVYPDSQTGKMVLSESSSIYTFVPQTTQTANNTGQTLADLVNSLTKSLASQGYQIQ